MHQSRRAPTKYLRLWPIALPLVWLAACALDRTGNLEVETDPGSTTTNAGGSMPTTTSSTFGGSGGVTSNTGGSSPCNGPGDCDGAICVNADAGLLIPAETCDPGGCSTETASPCPNGFKCAGDACLTSCAGSDDCVSTHFCDLANNTCVPLLNQGDPCGPGNGCPNTCVDGVCCESACAGECESCAAADTGASNGTCAPVLAWSDPAGECVGANELACNGGGACAACGDDVDAPGDMAPPVICDSVNLGTNTCTIVAGAGEFNAGNPLNCPQNWHCVIDCSAQDSCRLTTIMCPTNYSCTIDCPTNDECRDTLIVCPTNGTCDVTCGDDGCEDGTIECGSNECSVDCISGENKPPTITQGSTCRLTEDCL